MSILGRLQANLDGVESAQSLVNDWLMCLLKGDWETHGWPTTARERKVSASPVNYAKVALLDSLRAETQGCPSLLQQRQRICSRKPDRNLQA